MCIKTYIAKSITIMHSSLKFKVQLIFILKTFQLRYKTENVVILQTCAKYNTL